MNDKNLRAEELANKLFNKTISPEEEQELHSWYNQHLDDQVEIPHGFVSSEEEHRVRILEAINVGIGKRKVVRLWPRVAVAVAVAMVTLGVWLYYTTSINGRHPDAGQDPGSAQYANDIVPGKNAATLTLANGKVITLSDAKSGVVVDKELKYDDGTTLSGLQPSLPEGERSMMLTASTPRGGTYQITLPDGSKVWLNAASSIRFPASFSGLVNRKVVLDGEAYFEVSKNKKQPFVVETKNQDVTVLGTHFNVNSYDDEPDTRTTLLEGSVQVTPKHVSTKQVAAKAQVMKPGQQAILDKRFEIQLKQVTDLEYFIAWRASGANDPGSMAFDNNTLEEVMRRISRWYNVTVEYRGNVKRDIRFSGMIKRNVPLSKVLRLLEATTQSVEFKIEGRRLIVMN